LALIIRNVNVDELRGLPDLCRKFSRSGTRKDLKARQDVSR